MRHPALPALPARSEAGGSMRMRSEKPMRHATVFFKAGITAALASAGLFACAHLRTAETARCENLETLKLDHAEVVSASASSAGHRFSLPALFLAHTLFL